MNMHKQELQAYFSSTAEDVLKWHKRNKYYYRDLKKLLRFVIPPGSSVCEIGSGTAELLDAVKPARGVGVDLSPKVIEVAKKRYPHLEFYQGDIDRTTPINGTFDYLILSDLVGYLEDMQSAFENLRLFCHAGTRIVVTQYNRLWSPILKIGEWLRLKQPQPIMNWLSRRDVEYLFELAGFEVLKYDRRLLVPIYIPLISSFFNRVIAPLPGFNRLCIAEYLILRLRPEIVNARFSVSVVVPARNEKGNIEEIVRRIPAMGISTEIIFVEGGSTDGTAEEINRIVRAYQGQRNIVCLTQDGQGKGDAVRSGFANAKGDILMILDADLSVEPEALTKFYDVLSTRRGEYIHGTRLIYTMERQAMRPLNFLANRFFGIAFSWVLGQRITDTLCGTKVFFKKDYETIAENRKYFGEFDPYGDFDLIFGAAKLNLKIVEIPIHYKARTYGSTNISRFQGGGCLLRMLLFAVRRIKFV